MKKLQYIKPVVSSVCFLLCAANARADWQPILDDAATNSLLSFDAGFPATVTAPTPGSPSLAFPVLGNGITSNTTPVSSVSGGWDLVSSGAMAVYATGTNLASALTSATTSPGNLEFNALTSGVVGNLAGIELPSAWSATATVPGSNNWSSPDDLFLYQFDLDLNSSVLSLSPGVLPAIGLLIEDSTGTDLYRADNLGQLLGIADLTTQSFDDVGIPFTFDPANGPLSITWTGNSLVSAALLNNGLTNVLTVSDSSVSRQTAVPEISVAGLAGLAGATLLLRRRRSRN